jgi:hypothetical protein
MSRTRRFIALSILALLLAIGFSANVASAYQFGFFYLTASCCAGDHLYGSRVNISTPLSPGWTLAAAGECAVVFSHGTLYSQYHIEAGYGQCRNLRIGNTCYATTSPFFTYVEYLINGVYSCTLVGQVGYNYSQKYSVLKDAVGGYWRGYIDGVAKGPPPGVLLGNADEIHATGELTDSSAGSGYSWFGLSDPKWQRWNGTVWYTIQSASWCTKYDALDACGTGSWVHSGAPPLSFTVERP